MTEQPKRIPLWMKVDTLIILAGVIIVTIGIWIANARLFDGHPW